MVRHKNAFRQVIKVSELSGNRASAVYGNEKKLKNNILIVLKCLSQLLPVGTNPDLFYGGLIILIDIILTNGHNNKIEYFCRCKPFSMPTLLHSGCERS